jgi:hypothetical protein
MAHHQHQETELERLQGMQYGLKAMDWSGWGSPVGLGLFLVSLGAFLWLLHLANILG